MKRFDGNILFRAKCPKVQKRHFKRDIKMTNMRDKHVEVTVDSTSCPGVTMAGVITSIGGHNGEKRSPRLAGWS